MTSLNISNNSLGELVLPEGWTTKTNYGAVVGYKHTDGRERKEPPEGSSPDGAIALADAIKNNGALTSLNLASNRLGAEGAKHVAKAIKGHVSALSLRIVPF